MKRLGSAVESLVPTFSSAKQLTHGSPKPAMSYQNITAVHKTAPAPSRVSNDIVVVTPHTLLNTHCSIL